VYKLNKKVFCHTLTRKRLTKFILKPKIKVYSKSLGRASVTFQNYTKLSRSPKSE